MQLDKHVAQVSEQLQAAAALGDERTREVAGALSTAATPAVRLAVLNALNEAADEITAALLDFPGSPVVSLRLDGDTVAVDVHVSHPPTAEAEEPRRDDGEASARISLRLSEALKSEIDAAAEQEGVSVNTWLVRAASAALRPGPFAAFGPGFPFNFGPNPWGARGRGKRGDQHITGWIDG
jgi:predicted HicB family RNase H-like nuclease